MVVQCALLRIRKKIKFISGFRVDFPEDPDPGLKDGNLKNFGFFDEKGFFFRRHP
jgi:hypothetical protein